MGRVDTLAAVDTPVGESAALQVDAVADSAAMLAVAATLAADTGKLPAILRSTQQAPGQAGRRACLCFQRPHDSIK
jgi:hypothetical protein